MVLCEHMGQIYLDKLKRDAKDDLKSVRVPLELDTGLGIFDAFFASWSMIIVSEVCTPVLIVSSLNYRFGGQVQRMSHPGLGHPLKLIFYFGLCLVC